MLELATVLEMIDGGGEVGSAEEESVVLAGKELGTADEEDGTTLGSSEEVVDDDGIYLDVPGPVGRVYDAVACEPDNMQNDSLPDDAAWRLCPCWPCVAPSPPGHPAGGSQPFHIVGTVASGNSCVRA